MSLTVEDDFRDFVVACWADLESVAMMVTLDADTARRVTTDSLARLHHRWRDALDQGLPGALARGAVLTSAVAAARPPRPRTTADAGAPARAQPTVSLRADGSTTRHPALGEWLGEGTDEQSGDRVVLALVEVLRAATPVQRAVVAGGAVWSLLPAEVATLLGEPVTPTLQASSSLRATLLGAHGAARAAEGLAPAEWSFDRDLEDALDVLLDGQGDPPDPTALVEERRRTVQRRSVLTVGAVTVAAGTAAWWLLRDRHEAPAAAPRPPATTPGPVDVSWDRTASWPARGDLAADAEVQALVLARSTQPSRLLWADDVGARRVVIAAALETSQSVGTVLRAWHGPRGTDPASLDDVPLTLSSIEGVRDVVALILPNGDATETSRATLVIVLSHPTEGHASYSMLVAPTRDGRIERRWTQLPLQNGVGVTVVDQRLSPATRVRVGAYDGPPATPDPLWLGGEAADATPESFTAAVHAYVERATGIPARRLRTEVVADSPVSSNVLDPAAPSADDVAGRVVALVTRTPWGGVLSSVIVTDDGRGGGDRAVVRPVVVLPAKHAGDPVVERIGDERDRVARFLVVAPGAARIQLLGTHPNAYPVSKVVDARGRAATIVPVVNGADAYGFRVVIRDASRKVLFNGVPAFPKLLLDLWPGG